EVGEDLGEREGAAVGGELLVDVLDAGFVSYREAGAAATGDAAELEEAQLVPEGEMRQVVLDGPAVEIGARHLLVAEPGDRFADAISCHIHLEEKLVAGGANSHIRPGVAPATLTHAPWSTEPARDENESLV